MVSPYSRSVKAAAIVGGLGLLAIVGYADYVTGYEVSLLVFYLLPILMGLRYVGTAFAFVLAVLSALTSLFADIAAGVHYDDFLSPVLNTTIRLSIFLLIVVLFSNRDYLKHLVDQQTEKLRTEIKERMRLEKELLEVTESEQRRIGHDLHDSLGQHLTATALAGKILAKRLANKAAVEPAMADRLVGMVETAIDLTRNLARTLDPIGVGADSLEVALQNLAANVSEAFYVNCCFQNSGKINLTDPKSGIHLYRIAQEAASNAIRHGRARNIAITLDSTSKSLMLAVTDDGTGLPADARTKTGMGLRIMDYRASMIGGTLYIQNLSAGGTRVVCILNPERINAENYADEN